MSDEMTKEDLDYYDEHQGSLTFPKTTSKQLTKLFRAKSIGSVLDCGCGTGTYTIPLAKSGLDVTGIDIEKSMMNRAKEKAKKQNVDAKLLIADMTKFKPENNVGAIISMYNTIAVLNRNKFEKTLKHWHSSLHEGGLLVFDVYNFDYMKKRLITTRYLTNAERDGNKFYVVFHNDKLDEKNKIIKVRMEIYKQNEWTDLTRDTFKDDLHLYSINELKSILKRTGFNVIETHGGYSSKGFLPFRNEKSEFIVIIAENTNK